jgi:hypothetical protein
MATDTPVKRAAVVVLTGAVVMALADGVAIAVGWFILGQVGWGLITMAIGCGPLLVILFIWVMSRIDHDLGQFCAPLYRWIVIFPLFGDIGIATAWMADHQISWGLAAATSGVLIAIVFLVGNGLLRYAAQREVAIGG